MVLRDIVVVVLGDVLANVARLDGLLQLVDVAKDHPVVQVDLHQPPVVDFEDGHPTVVALCEDVEVADDVARLQILLLKEKH